MSDHVERTRQMTLFARVFRALEKLLAELEAYELREAPAPLQEWWAAQKRLSFARIMSGEAPFEHGPSADDTLEALSVALQAKVALIEARFCSQEQREQLVRLSLLKRAALAIEQLQARLGSAQRRTSIALEQALSENAQAGIASESIVNRLPPLVPVARDGLLPLSFPQLRLWFLEQLDPGKPLYNEFAAIFIRGALNVDALERSFSEIVRRHEILRTTLSTVDGEPVQRIVPWRPFHIDWIDVQHWPEDERAARAVHLAEGEIAKPLDLTNGPLFKVLLYQLAEDSYLHVSIFHHTIGDGWSMNILYRELRAIYEAFCVGEPSPLPELPVQYADFAAWQRRWLQGEVLEKQLTFWKEQLAGAPTVLALPSDRPRPTVPSKRGADFAFEVPQHLAGALKALAQREGLTLFMLLLGSFQLLLYRYTGQDDILVGTPIANRTRAEAERLIGFFANTLVLRGKMDGNPTVREFLERVKAFATAAYNHQDIPFEQLVAALQPVRDLSYSPLFQVMFVLQHKSWFQMELGGLEISAAQVERERATFDLVLAVIDSDETLHCSLEYNTDLFDAQTIARLAGHWQSVLEHVVADPQQRLKDIAVLTAWERTQLLDEWNNTAAPYPQGVCLHQLVEFQAARTPDAVAVSYGDEQLTYDQLNRCANRLAWYLRELSVGAETLVGICVERSLEMIVSVLGVLKAGGAYVPLDPAYPQERLAYMLEDAAVPILLTRQHLLREHYPSRLRVVCVDADWPQIARMSDDTPELNVTSSNLAYVIYTSGSTGKPKGVMVSHEGVSSLIEMHRQTYAQRPGEHMLQFVSFNFDVSVADIFMTLQAGARLCLVPSEAAMPGESLLRIMREQAITLARFPAAVFSSLPVGDLPDLGIVSLGGDCWNPDVLEQWHAVRSLRFFNEYGPTEATVCATSTECIQRDNQIIGRPVGNVRTYVLDDRLAPVPIGVPGELYIGGIGLARGYLHRADLTAERFIPDPSGRQPGARLYRTGDLVRYRRDGALEFLGRVDNQVKVRGFRIELGEIEASLAGYPAVQETVVVAREDASGEKRLVAYVVAQDQGAFQVNEARAFLKELLPEYMVPVLFVLLDALPLTHSGKVDRRALPAPEEASRTAAEEYVAPQTALERCIAEIWRAVLSVEQVSARDNFFDLGGHSLAMVKVHDRLRAALKADLTLVDLFKYPTISSLAQFIAQQQGPSVETKQSQADLPRQRQRGNANDIAIIGVAGRFPQAHDVEEFWQNIQHGVEAVSFFSEEELLAAGVAPQLFHLPRYVRAGAVLDDIEFFDAEFFGFNPREAEIIDPQQRLFLECAWQAFEDAGYDPEQYQGAIGVYGGQSMNMYLASNLLRNSTIAGTIGFYQLGIGNSVDFLTTRVSYKLNLRGPSVTVQTACSTSLVATHMACESLRAGECAMALAGGVSIRVPQKTGYLYEEGGILSPDGHCRAFDASSQGIVAGEGVGVVLLKRLEDALADGDHIYAVIKGSAINNDGSVKVGYTAPSVRGQAQVIAEALAMAEVGPESIGYIEAHGTGTPIGDPIEIAALKEVYGSDPTQRCAIGSVKTNIGHLDAAAGIAGLLKTIFALQHQTLPPSLHFVEPNPALDLRHSPFYVNTTQRTWERAAVPRRAAVSSFGIGGTNAHVILEEAPPRAGETAQPQRPYTLLTLSARSVAALQQARTRLLTYLQQHPELDLADVAYTLQVGRRAFQQRMAIVCRDRDDALRLLSGSAAPHSWMTSAAKSAAPVAFLFPGQGAQYLRMGEELYWSEPLFRDVVDRCAELLQPHLGLDLRAVLYPPTAKVEEATAQLNQTQLTQPALFVIEYALAKLWMAWGIQPQMMIGHSIGEYVAACLADVFSLEDALMLVAARGRLLQTLPAGAMLMVACSEEEVQPLLGMSLSLAAHNGVRNCVVSGPIEAIEQLELQLTARGVAHRRLHTSHAFHSQMMEPVLRHFQALVQKVKLSVPRLPYLSNVTGTWIKPQEATDAAYWVKHLRQTVRFVEGLMIVCDDPTRVLLEVGPGRTLAGLARRYPEKAAEQLVLSSLRHPQDEKSDSAVLLTTCAQLWVSGQHIDWAAMYAHEPRRRVSLPTYPFERKRYWVTPDVQAVPQPGSLHPVHTEQVAISEDEQAAASVSTIGHSYSRPDMLTEYVAAENELQRRIAGIWQRLLGIEPIGIHDNFFDLNGDSLLATQVIAHVRAELHVELPLSVLFEEPTVAGLAQRVEWAQTQQQQTQVERIAVTRPAELPLSFAQQRLWFLDQLEPGNVMYNIPGVLRLRGGLDVPLLEQSFVEVIRRHESLRTTFRSIEGRPVQVISDSTAFSLSVTDLRELPFEQRDVRVQQLAREQAAFVFDLSRGPLFHAHLLRVDDEDWIFLFTIHHSIADGWSMEVLVRDLSAFYRAFVGGEPVQLPPLPIQYADYALWQREWLQGNVLATQLDYWQRQLSGVPVLELPTDHPRPAVQSYRGAAQALDLSAELSEQLQALSKREGVTLFMTLLAAFQVLLMRYSGQHDIAVGTPIANRTRAEVEGLIGFFVNTLVLRGDLAGNPSFRQLLERVRESTLNAYLHQDVPFEQVVDALQLERDLSRSPLFQVMFVLQNTPVAGDALPGLITERLDPVLLSAKFDLTMTVVETAQGLRCVVEYCTDLFEAATIARLLQHWQTLLAGVVAQPETPLGSLPLLSEIEIQRLIAAPVAAYPDDVAWPVLFEAQVVRTPDAIVLVFEDEQLTYAELNRRANQLAHYLRSVQVGPGSLVPICIERSLDLVIGLLGILKAGGAYVPLDPTYPQERLALMVEDMQAPVVVTQERLLERLPQGGQLHVCLDRDRAEIARQHEDNPVPQTSPDDLVYVIYTSGSTGKPKGAGVYHRGFVNLLHWFISEFALSAVDRDLLVTSISFDLTQKNIFAPLLAGATVQLFASSVYDARLITQVIAERQISLLNCTPSAFYPLLDALDMTEWPRLSPLRHVFLGGEPIAVSRLQDWLASEHCHAQIVNTYGPTECSDVVSFYRLVPSLTDIARAVPIGRAIANTSLLVLDEEQQVTPVGVSGELYIAGDSVGAGYINDRELTAAKFVPNPYRGSAGRTEQLYRTGDLARYREDGAIEFVGRVDHQVKLRGFRIEPGEIEAALGQHFAVSECLVMVRADAQGDPRLVAYVVAREGEALVVEELRRSLQKKLPEYMVPSIFVVLERFPLTPSGKVDRNALPVPVWSGTETAEQDALACHPLVELLIGLYAEVLGVTQVGASDSFFALGGHSLLATQLVSRVRKVLHVELPLRALFEAPAPVTLVRHVEAALRQQLPDMPLVPIVRDQRLELSFAQQRLWFLYQLDPQSTAYNIPAVVRLTGRLDRSALERSLAELVSRHESLRTVFVEQEDRPMQIILDQPAFNLPSVDVSLLPEEQREARIKAFAEEHALYVFDLSRGPLYRAHLLKVAEEEYIFLLTMHHIISDGWSIEVFMREFAALYNAFVKGEPAPLPPLPIQYADYAAWQREWLRGEVLERQLAYWKQQLADVPVLELPTDHPRPAVQSYRGTYQTLDLSAELSGQLQALSRREGVTLFMTLLAAFQVLLMRYSGQRDIAVGTPIANRTRAEIEGLIGFFVNTLVLRTDLTGNPSFRQLLERVRESTLNAYLHQDVPFEQVVDALQPERDLSRSPLFQVMFVMQNAPAAAEALDDLTLERMDPAFMTSKFDLTMTVIEAPDGLRCVVDYCTDLFEDETIARLLQHWQTLLARIVATPECTIAHLPVLTPVEQQQILYGWNATERVYPLDRHYAQLFWQQVERTPDVLAVAYGRERLTYAQLYQRANQVAIHLRTMGVGPEVLVGLYLPRSLDLLIAVLATFLAGGAYVPLDPQYPQQRLLTILRDARISMILTRPDLQERVPDLDGMVSLNVSTLSAEPFPVTFPQEWPWRDDRGDQLAYMIYTSGSTGLPKGAMVTQRGMLNHLYAKIETLQMQEGDRLAFTASPSFDISVWQMLSPLLCGGQVHILDEETVRDPRELIFHVQRERIQIVEVVPTLLQALLDVMEQEQRSWSLALRWLVVTGEALPAQVARRWLGVQDQIPLVNAYGPTECSDDVTQAVLRRGEDLPGERVPIGRALPNMRLYVLDEALQPVPVGVLGEIYVGGVGVGRGYWRQESKTAAVFIPDHFASAYGATGRRLYKTGDVGRYRPDGQLEFVRRVDEQVKVRGYRIELGEIEAVLSRHPDIQRCIVIVHEEGQSGRNSQRLIGYVVPQSGKTVVVQEVRAYLKELLPEYMLPAALVVLEQLPITPNGKIDRKALPVPETSSEASLVWGNGPRGEVERLVQEIWVQVLGREGIGIQENFFEAGGHSLLATQVRSRIRAVCGVELPLRTLFEATTIEEQARLVEQQLRQGGSGEPPLLPVVRGQEVALSYAQQRLWFLYMLEPQSPAYNIFGAVRLAGTLDVQALAHSLEEVVLRHEALRTVFREHDGQPIQLIEPVGQTRFRLIDLQTQDPAECAAEIERLMQQEATQPFDLASGPLLRVTLLRQNADSATLLLTMHHIISDGWSIGVLVRELTALYAAYLENEPSPLPPLPIQYADYALWQRDWLQGEVLREQIRYWTRQLSEAKSLELPTDRPRSAVQRYRGAGYTFQLPQELAGALQQLSRQEGATLFMVLLAAFQVLMSRLSGQQDVVVGTDSANRSRVETESLIGFFVNLLALRTTVQARVPFRELLQRVKEMVLGAYTHQDLPFEMIVEHLRLERQGNRTPLVNVLFVMQNVPAMRIELPGLQVQPIEHEITSSKFDLAFFVSEEVGGIRGLVHYSSDLFALETIQTITQRFELLLRSIVARPDAPVEGLEIATEAEKVQKATSKKQRIGVQMGKLKEFKEDLIDLA